MTINSLKWKISLWNHFVLFHWNVIDWYTKNKMGLNQAFYENGSEVDFFTFLKQSTFGVVKGVLV